MKMFIANLFTAIVKMIIPTKARDRYDQARPSIEPDDENPFLFL